MLRGVNKHPTTNKRVRDNGQNKFNPVSADHQADNFCCTTQRRLYFTTKYRTTLFVFHSSLITPNSPSSRRAIFPQKLGV